MDDGTAAILAVLALQAMQLAQTTILGRTVRRSLRPPPPPASRGTPVVWDGEEDPTPAERRRR